MTDKYLAAARAAHTKALGKPQAFSLTGDGEAVDLLLNGIERPREAAELAAALTEARYHDWRAGGSQGEFLARFADGAAPEFSLTAEAPAGDRRYSGQGTAQRLALATRIIAALVDEFGELFPEELAAAVQFIGE